MLPGGPPKPAKEAPAEHQRRSDAPVHSRGLRAAGTGLAVCYWISGMAESSFTAHPAVMSRRHANPKVCPRCAAELHSDPGRFEHSRYAPEAQRVLSGEIRPPDRRDTAHLSTVVGWQSQPHDPAAV